MSHDASSTTTLPPPPCRLPLAVAVTGHRDIAPVHDAMVRLRVREKLQALKLAHPHTPLLVLCGLAEGADMLCAEAALDLGIECIAVLPAAPEVFARDFETPAHPERDPQALRARFEALLARCSTTVVVGEGKHANKAERYLYVGAYLVRRCHVLLALWDGQPRRDNESMGGTAHVVQLAMDGIPNRYRGLPTHALDAPDPAPVFHLRTPRREAPLPQAFTWQELASPLQNTWAELEAFNIAASTFEKQHPEAIAQSKRNLCLLDDELTFAERRILQAYATADAMAIQAQRRTRVVLDWMYYLTLIMIASFAVHSNVWASVFLYTLYYLSFFIGWQWHRKFIAQNVHAQCVEFRGLAEGLRVQLFYQLSCVRMLAADLYLRRQRREMQWIRRAMRALEIGQRRCDPLPPLVLERWIKDQLAYFVKAQRRDSEKLHWYERVSKHFFLAGLLIGGVGLVVELYDFHMHDSMLVHWLFMLMGLFPALAAMSSSYAFRRNLGQQVREYDKMRELFDTAVTRITADQLIKKPHHFKRLVKELGREALAENAQWVMQHRGLPPDLPSK